jgi:hypothetical protein
VAKVVEAQRILKALGLPDKQQTTLAGHILLGAALQE